MLTSRTLGEASNGPIQSAEQSAHGDWSKAACDNGRMGFWSSATTSLQVLQQLCHRGIQARRDDLQRDDADLSLAPLNVRDVSSVHVQVGCHVGLRPSLLFSQGLDPLSQPDQEGMTTGGHAPIVGVLFTRCVWYARQDGLPTSH